MKNFYLIIPFFLFFLVNNYTQDFGEIPEELLKMTSLAEDPEEDAAVIFDKASIKITKDFWLETKRHVRIKVFTEEGKKQANIEIVLWHEDVIDDIEAISISPDGKEFELDSDNIFTEETDRTKKISFPIPGVEKGSVFEFSYEVRSEYISHLEPWSFQSDIYTKYSEIKVFLPQGFAYQRLSTNLELYDLQESVDKAIDPDNPQKKLSVFTWSCKNLPGIKEEPYTDNIEDNYAQILFILVSFKNEYVNYTFRKSWDDIATRIYKDYSKLIDDNDSEDLVKEMIGTESNDLKKANKIYNYVRTQIKTTNHKSLRGENFKVPSDVLMDKSGSSSEKSMLLINMLNQAGFDAKPVWISTRKNGPINPNFCDESQFNRLICMLTVGTENYFLYPVSLSSTFGCLSPAIDVPNGLLIEPEKGSIISVKSIPVLNAINIITAANIDSENNLTVKTRIQYSGYSASDERDALLEKDPETYVKDFLKAKFAEAKIDTFYYMGLDSIDSPLELDLLFSIPNYLEEIEQLGNFAIPFFTAVNENPFVRPKRSNPIDFEYAVLKSENIKIELPEYYRVSQVPKRRKTLMTGAGFNQVYGIGDNFIECSRTLDFRSRRLSAKNYLDVKSLYDDLVSSSQDQVVVTKSVQGN